MRDSSKKSRRAQIELAAYDVLHRKGYAGTSMLAIAKAAKASNETLYRWYGDKIGLFAALIANNAAHLKATLETALNEDQDPVQTLKSLAPLLLGTLTSARVIALNRAAAADETGTLGAAIAQGGRDTIAPLIASVITQAIERGQVAAPSPRIATEWYIALVIGDAQIRRVTGAVPEPSEAHIVTLAEARVAAFLKLVAPAV
ncbi:MAG: TetR/AcrR family transcriptional regulator [Pseudomonadota bacterium]